MDTLSLTKEARIYNGVKTNSLSLNDGIFLTSLYALILAPSKLLLEIKFKFFKIMLEALHDLSSAYLFCFISCCSYQLP